MGFINYFFFLLTMIASAYGAVATLPVAISVATHEEISLFRLQHKDRINLFKINPFNKDIDFDEDVGDNYLPWPEDGIAKAAAKAVAVQKAREESITVKDFIGITNLEILGALWCLNEKRENGELSKLQFARFVLGMMLGNGYQKGVTTTIKAMPNERKEIERIVKRAIADLAQLNFSDANIWSIDAIRVPLQQHAQVLNGWWTANPAPRALVTNKNAQAYNNTIDPRGDYAELLTAAMNLHMKGQDEVYSHFIGYFSGLSDEDKGVVLNAYIEKKNGGTAAYAKEASIRQLVARLERELPRALRGGAAGLEGPPVLAPPAVAAPPVAPIRPLEHFERFIRPDLPFKERQMLQTFISVADIYELNPEVKAVFPDFLRDLTKFFEDYARLTPDSRASACAELANLKHQAGLQAVAVLAIQEPMMQVYVVSELCALVQEKIRIFNYRFDLAVVPLAAPEPVWAMDHFPGDPFIVSLIKDHIKNQFNQQTKLGLEKQRIAEFITIANNFHQIGIDGFLKNLVNLAELERIDIFINKFAQLSKKDKKTVSDYLNRLIFQGKYSGALGGKYQIADAAPATYATTAADFEKLTIPGLEENNLLRCKAQLALDTCAFLDDQIRRGVIRQLSDAEVAVDEAAKASWIFWEDTGRPKRFDRPDNLSPRANTYISFFMEEVMPKLVELFKARKITARDIAYVQRGASMGIIGMEEQDLYMQGFRNGHLDRLVPEFDGKVRMIHAMVALLGSEFPFTNFKDISLNDLLFKVIQPDDVWRVTPFYAIHAENIIEPYIIAYNRQVDKSPVALAALKQEATAGFRAALNSIAIMVYEGFSAFLHNPVQDAANEGKLITFIKGFDTNHCFDGTSSSILDALARNGMLGIVDVGLTRLEAAAAAAERAPARGGVAAAGMGAAVGGVAAAERGPAVGGAGGY